MRLFQWHHFILGALALLISSCVDPYDPDINPVQQNLLVVDGFINSQGTTTFKISRTQGLKEKTGPVMEVTAQVWIEEEQGPPLVLPHTGKGVFSASLAINPAKRYRLRVKTANQKEYLSDFIPVKITPPIDAVSWKLEDNGVQISANTHDDQGKTQYYRWDYEETFEFVTAFYSSLVYINRQILPRTDNIYRCWRSGVSSNIILASTVKLNQDRISEAPILHIPANSIKLGFLYSILVKQTAQTKESYQYWETLRKNTEDIGTLFDPLPTQLTGNIKCISNPAEPVLGFVTATSVTEKRIFINAQELPGDWLPPNEYNGCQVDTINPNQVNTAMAGKTPLIELFSPMGSVIGYIISETSCVDCRLRGTNVKPAYWPN